MIYKAPVWYQFAAESDMSLTKNFVSVGNKK